MSAGSCLLRLRPALGALSLVACGDTGHSPAAAESAAGQGGSAASPALGGLSVLGVVDRQDGNCTIKASAAANLLALGTLDRALASSYSAVLLLQSTNAERVALRSVEVSLEAADGTPPVAYSLAVTGFLGGGGQGSTSVAVATAELLPPALTQRLEADQLLRLSLTLHAKPVSGEAGDIESAALLFPIELCEGCLVSYPAAARDPASLDGSYLCLTGAPAAATLGNAPQPCQAGIDAPVSCATCSDAVALCRDPTLNPTR